MNQETGIRQGKAVFFFCCQINVGCDAANPAGADNANHRLNELNHVVDGVTAFYMSARRTHV